MIAQVKDHANLRADAGGLMSDCAGIKPVLTFTLPGLASNPERTQPFMPTLRPAADCVASKSEIVSRYLGGSGRDPA
jgi:hypothetical protein